MARARRQIVRIEETPYYHVTSRCVRRAFLCGKDPGTGRSYAHRRAWIEQRVRVLSSLFSVELCAYAVMANHYLLVLRLNPAESAQWSDDDVLNRWTTLFRGPMLVQQYRAGKCLSAAELDALRSMAAVFRRRLASLSWFMKCLNEPIAKMANAEDGCTGHFWEARFHSQPLKTECALLAAMAYVDLNPVRARLAKVPEKSAYTSLRIRALGNEERNALDGVIAGMLQRGEDKRTEVFPRPLMPFSDSVVRNDGKCSAQRLPIRESDYFLLVDLTGRTLRCGKRGGIQPALSPILDRIGLSAKQWIAASTAFQAHYRRGHMHKAA